MTLLAAIHILCETNPSFGTTIVNGLLGSMTVLGGVTVFCSGVPAAVAVFIPSRPNSLERRINRCQGYGFIVGVPAGLLTFFVFIAKVVS